MFFFEFVNPIHGLKTQHKSSKPEPTPYTPTGQFTRKQRVVHPVFGPGVVTLVRLKMVAILFDSEKQNPPRQGLLEIEVKGRRFLSANLSAKERDKANGASLALLRARSKWTRWPRAGKEAPPSPVVRCWWKPHVRPETPHGTPRWQRQHPASPRHMAVLPHHGLHQVA